MVEHLLGESVGVTCSDLKYLPRVMIEGDRKIFNKRGVDRIINSSSVFSAPGATIKIVSVVGSVSSGKSTLMNYLLGCDFEVMNEDVGIQQTTKGLWASECVIPNLLVVDVEGSDGKERAKEDDVAFERKCALFALTVSNVMIFNLWAKDVALNNGGCVPLFETIFRERVKFDGGQTRLLVVLRAYNQKVKFEKLKTKMMDSLKEIWDKVNNSEGQENVSFSSYIDVEVVALADTVDRVLFEKEVAELMEWFKTKAFVGFHQRKILASDFSHNAEILWEKILLNKKEWLKLGPCGGLGGSEYTMDPIDVKRITKLVIRSGWAIDALSFSYERHDGSGCVVGPCGGSGGSVNKVRLGQDEYITSVSGHHGRFFHISDMLRSLKIVTNVRTYGPYGMEEGVPFNFNAYPRKIIGFFGKSGLYVDAIGVHVSE